MKQKKWMALLLSATLLTGLFAGCGKDAEETQNPDKPAKPGESETQVVQPRYAYKTTYQTIQTPDGQDFDYVGEFSLSGDTMYFSASYVTGKEQALDDLTGEPILDEATGEPVEWDTYENGMFCVNLDTGAVTNMGFEPTPIPEGVEGDSGIQSVTGSPDGTLYVLENVNTYTFDLPEGVEEGSDESWEYYVPGENYFLMSRYDADGQKQGEARLELPEESYLDRLFVDSQGNVFAWDYQNVYLFGADGKLIKTIELQNAGQLCQLSADKIGVMSYDGEGPVLKVIDPATGEFNEEIKLPMMANEIYPGFDKYDFLYSQGDAVYGYVTADEAGEKLFSWIDCDVDTNNVRSFQILDDGRVAAISNTYDGERSRTELLMLEPVDPATLPKKEELVLGCMYLDYSLRTNVVNFNRAHDDVRIVIRDYSELAQDGDYAAAVQKMNTEILSGKGPDLISSQGMPLDQYAAKGVLLDLWPLIDGDQEVGRDKLMEHFFDALSIDGKLYAVSDSFSIQTAATKKSIAGDRTSWTLDEMLEALHTLQPGATVFSETTTKDQMLSQCISFNMDAFVDWETGATHFDSPEFISVLEFANNFNADFDWENYDWENAEGEYTRIQEGKQLMSTCYISDFTDVQVQNAFHGGEVSFIGFPSETGNGSCFMPGMALSISSACKNPEAAWAFARELLLEENQKDGHMWGLPTNKAAFDAKAKEAMTPTYYTDPETGEQVEESHMGVGIGNDFELEVYACTQAELDALMELYNNCENVYTQNEEIMKLVNEEAKAYFDGQKTAEETANLIQGRVGLYIMEQG